MLNTTLSTVSAPGHVLVVVGGVHSSMLARDSFLLADYLGLEKTNVLKDRLEFVIDCRKVIFSPPYKCGHCIYVLVGHLSHRVCKGFE